MVIAPAGVPSRVCGEDCLRQTSLPLPVRDSVPEPVRSGLSASNTSSCRSDCRRDSAHCVESWAILFSCWLTAGFADTPVIR
eukprot:5650445-Prymnesium_polylepis.2